MNIKRNSSERSVPRTILRVELLRNGIIRVLQLFKQSGCNGEVVNTSQGLNLANLKIPLAQSHYGQEIEAYVAERGSHNDGLVTVLLVVVEDLLDRLYTRVLFALVILSC